MLIRIAVLCLILFSLSYSQEENQFITVVGDSLVGKMINGESIREVYGNVVLTQGNVVITCNKAIQYISRNDAELIGDVVAKQDSLTIRTPEGFYYGNQRKSESTKGVTLDDGKVILKAQNGEYFFNEDRAYFWQNVVLYDSVSTLTSDELTYFRNLDKAIAVGRVKIVDPKSLIQADSLEHYRKEKNTIANSNVSVKSLENNTIIYGDHLEDYSGKNYTLVNRNPLLMQIDTSNVTVNDTTEFGVRERKEQRLDTLVIVSKVMEAFRDSTNKFIATDSVKIVRGNFASINDLTIYFRSAEKIATMKTGKSKQQPVLWYENSQLTGDSVLISLYENSIKNLFIFRNAFLLSQHKIFKQRFDQSTGDTIRIFFNDNKVDKSEFDGSVFSIYYIFEEDEPNGLIKSSSQSAKIIFTDNEVDEVRLFGSPNSEYYPENKVVGLEKSFTLPRFFFYENRPIKEFLLKDYFIKIKPKSKLSITN
jgi:lipopolysaccharide export system protein LptA